MAKKNFKLLHTNHSRRSNVTETRLTAHNQVGIFLTVILEDA